MTTGVTLLAEARAAAFCDRTTIADLHMIQTARPGEILIYHVGCLTRDRKTSPALDEIASEVAKQEQRGWMDPLQRKLAKDVYEYRAVKRRHQTKACDWPLRQDALMKKFSGKMK